MGCFDTDEKVQEYKEEIMCDNRRLKRQSDVFRTN